MKKIMKLLSAVFLITFVFMGCTKSEVSNINEKTEKVKEACYIVDVKTQEGGVRDVTDTPLNDEYLHANWKNFFMLLTIKNQ
jgi:PBP1b-binding outer membrane lipoprotein LpoB